jgi:hypothetical protein
MEVMIFFRGKGTRIWEEEHSLKYLVEIEGRLIQWRM